MLNVPARSTLVAVVALLSWEPHSRSPPRGRAGEPITLHHSGTFTPPIVVSTQPLIVFTTDHLTGDGSPLRPFTGVYPHHGNFDTGNREPGRSHCGGHAPRIHQDPWARRPLTGPGRPPSKERPPRCR
jgi:hypothetical protein